MLRHPFFDIAALAASAHAVDVRVVKLEGLLEVFGHKIDVRAIEVHQNVVIHHDACTIRLKAVIIRTQLINELEGMRQAGATHLPYANAQGNALAAFVELSLYLQRSSFSQCHGHL